MKNHDLIDKRSLELAKAVAGKIDLDSDRSGLAKAKKICFKWFQIHKEKCFSEWMDILEKPWEDIKKIYLDESENGKRLRQTSPFCGILTDKERMEIFKRFIEYEKRAS